MTKLRLVPGLLDPKKDLAFSPVLLTLSHFTRKTQTQRNASFDSPDLSTKSQKLIPLEELLVSPSVVGELLLESPFGAIT